MKPRQEKKSLHLKMGWRLSRALSQTGQREGRSPTAQAEYDLELILPVVQAESRYRIAPEQPDFDPLTHDLGPCLVLDCYEFLVERAKSLGLSVNEYARELLWFVHECRIKLSPKGVILLKEEFQKRIGEHLKIRFAKVQ